MSILNTWIQYATILVFMLVFTALIAGAIMVYLLKIKKVRAIEEKIDYTKFVRTDSKEFIKFDRLINSSSLLDGTNSGILVTKNYTEFTAAIMVDGFNFYDASAEEQKSTILGMYGFLNILEDKLQLRMTSQALDLQSSYSMFEKKAEELKEQMMHDVLDREELLKIAEEYLEQPDIYRYYEERMQELENRIESRDWQLKELESQMGYLSLTAGKDVKAQKNDAYIFTWHYDSSLYTEDLDRTQIMIKAIQALESKGRQYIQSLSNAKCRARRATVYELGDMFIRQTHPITFDDLRMQDMFSEENGVKYVTSDALYELERQRIGDYELQKMQEAHIESLRRQEEETQQMSQSFEQMYMEDLISQMIERNEIFPFQEEDGNVSYYTQGGELIPEDFFYQKAYMTEEKGALDIDSLDFSEEVDEEAPDLDSLDEVELELELEDDTF